jgi:hypothetical protein
MTANQFKQRLSEDESFQKHSKDTLKKYLTAKRKPSFGALDKKEKSDFFKHLDRTYDSKTEKMKQEGNVTLDQIVDYEGEMVKQQMAHICQWSSELRQTLDDQTQLEAWVQDKISKAHLHLQSVYEYLKHQHV